MGKDLQGVGGWAGALGQAGSNTSGGWLCLPDWLSPRKKAWWSWLPAAGWGDDWKPPPALWGKRASSDRYHSWDSFFLPCNPPPVALEQLGKKVVTGDQASPDAPERFLKVLSYTGGQEINGDLEMC